MVRSSDLEAGGGGFDSRLLEVLFGSLFREFWDVLGCVWEWFGDVFGRVWEGLGKNVGRGRKHDFVSFYFLTLVNMLQILFHTVDFP